MTLGLLSENFFRVDNRKPTSKKSMGTFLTDASKQRSDLCDNNNNLIDQA